MPLGKLTLIIGLPGSGKSTLKMERSEFHDDDFLRNELQPPRGYVGIVERLRAGINCAANDIALCESGRMSDVLERFRRDVPGVEVELIYFQNDPEQCIINVVNDHWCDLRHDVGARIHAIRRFTLLYEPPPDARPVPKLNLPGSFGRRLGADTLEV